jgi:hypothetical protein
MQARRGDGLKRRVTRSIDRAGVDPHAGFGWLTRTLVGMMTPLLPEGDLVRGRAPDLTSPHWRCGIVDRATGAVCTRCPHGQGQEHQGWAAVQGAGRSKKLVGWNGGREWAMVVDGYTWSRVPGTEVEVRVLADRPMAVRQQHYLLDPQHHGRRCPGTAAAAGTSGLSR